MLLKNQLSTTPELPPVLPPVRCSRLLSTQDISFKLLAALQPISKLTFWANMLEEVAAEQLNDYINGNDLWLISIRFRSGSWHWDNTFWVTNDLQLVWNAAERWLTRSSRRMHITPPLASLHWLLVCFLVDFKILMITNAFMGLALDHISDSLTPYKLECRLRSSGRSWLVIPKSRLTTWGGRAICSQWTTYQRITSKLALYLHVNCISLNRFFFSVLNCFSPFISTVKLLLILI